MRHPLVNPSLAPYGFVPPSSRRRLEYKSELPGYINCERALARLWDKAHRSNASHPRPIETIVHQILPGIARAHRLVAGDFIFDGLPYRSRDILVLSATVQWLGTNVGNSFLETDISKSWQPEIWQWGTRFFKSQYRYYHPEREFLIKLEKERHARFGTDGLNLPAMIFHECSNRCGSVMGLRHCYYDPHVPEPRDHVLVEGLMRWLAMPAGRAFIAAYQARRARARVQEHKRISRLARAS